MTSFGLIQFNSVSLFYFYLLGGLTPDNVCEAAHTAGVVGVDVSSGVEQKGMPGVKDLKVMKDFITNARL